MIIMHAGPTHLDAARACKATSRIRAVSTTTGKTSTLKMVVTRPDRAERTITSTPPAANRTPKAASLTCVRDGVSVTKAGKTGAKPKPGTSRPS
jgi:hypothetical protein